MKRCTLTQVNIVAMEARCLPNDDYCAVISAVPREHTEAIQLEAGYAKDLAAPEAVGEPSEEKHVRR